MNHWMRYLAALLLCILGTGTPAGAVDLSTSPFIVDSCSTKEGLPDGEVISIIQARDGYLWLGTLHGLVRFDGNRFAIFDENNTPGLGSGRIVYLFEDSHTNLWVGTDTGIVLLVHDGRIENFSLGRGGHEGRLTSAGEDANGAVWLYSADAHLGRYQNGKMDVLDLHIPVPAIARMIAVEKSGPIWIDEFEAAETNWLFSFQPANFNPPVVAFSEPILTRRPDFILASRRGGTWRMMDGQIQKWNASQPEKNLGPYPWGNSRVTAACEDNDGNLIVGTLGAGVFWYEADGAYRQISKAEGLSSDLVLSLCMDRGGESLGGNRR